MALDRRRRDVRPPPSPAAGSACRTRRRSPPLPRTTAVVGYQQLYLTDDDGGRVRRQGRDRAADSQVAAWAFLGFTDPTHGVALGYVGSVAPGNERLYYTIDGGQSYHLVPIP